MKRKPASIHGILPIDKPAGPTSRVVLDRAARLIGERRAGHAGTLDPPATGLLCLCFGEATKAVPWLMAEPKTYEAEIAFGAATTTDDATGEVVRTAPVPPDLARRTAEWLQAHVGAFDQRPPVVSALHRDGVRAHDRARRGQIVALEPRRVQLYEASVLAAAADRVQVRLRCGAGFYVRSLARDLGEALGSAAHVARLRRTAACGFEVGGAITLDDLQRLEPAARRALLTPFDAVLRRLLPSVAVDAVTATMVRQGKKPVLPVTSTDRDAEALLVLDPDDRAVAVVRPQDGTVAAILRGFVARPVAESP